MIFQILKRKDAYSVVLAISLGFFIMGFVTSTANDLLRYIPGIKDSMYVSSGASIKDAYLVPLILLIIEIVILELVVRVADKIAKYSR